MTKLRHSLALSALALLGCNDESAWETAKTWNSGALHQGDASPGDAETGSVDDCIFRVAAGGSGGASVDFEDAGSPRDDADATGVDWNTQFVKFHAEDFRIAVAGKTFRAQTSNASLNSDPGDDQYTTLESIWFEHGVEMRLNVYFHSDGRDWWASEIRVYDGRPDGDWLIATGEWFRSPVGQPFTGDLDLKLEEPCCAANGGNPGTGLLTIHGLQVQPFLTPEVCREQFSGYAIEVLYPTIEMTTAPNSGFGAAVRLRDRHCKTVVDAADFELVWKVDDPTLVELSTPFRPTNVQLRGLSAGKTTLRVMAKRRSDDVTVAEGTMTVIIKAARED